MNAIEVAAAAFIGGVIGGVVVSWRTWRDLLIDLRDHGWRNDR